jgi:hypothetical protein
MAKKRTDKDNKMATDEKKAQTTKNVVDGTPSQPEKIATAALRTHKTTNAATKEDFSMDTLKKLSDVRRGEIFAAKDPHGKKTGAAGDNPVVGVGMKKKADFGMDGSIGGMGPGRGVDRAMPELYSPLFQVANLNLPRDRMTMNAWNRNFYDTNPIVRNAINLHATYPISKINVKCKHRKVEQFFNDMAAKIDLFDAIAGISLEYWKCGEAFPYAELDEDNGIWSSIVVHNPDYVTVKKSGASNTSVISLRPDEILKKVVTSNHPADIKLRSQISENIIHHIRKNEPIPLDSFNVSHLKLLSSPYDVRGTSIIVSCYKELMLFDKLRECFSQDTEILTDSGFKKYNEIVEIDSAGNAVPINKYRIACYNAETDCIQYDNATAAVLRDYSGDMVRVKSKNIDLLVTPNHELLVKNEESGWHRVKAKELLGKRLKGYKVKNTATWVGQKVDHVDVLGKLIPAELYLKFMGYLLSEGCITRANDATRPNTGTVGFTQSITSDCFNDIRETVIKFATYFDKKVIEVIRQPKISNFKKLPAEAWQGSINCGQLYKHFKALVGTEDGCTSQFKHIPRWILELCPEQLKIMLDAMVAGDGSEYDRKHCKTFKYFTKSPQLASDVQEAVFKCGLYSSLRPYEQNGETYYDVCWSTSGFGKEPGLYNSRTNKSHVTTEAYDGKVWCVTVPTGIVTIRNHGRISIQFQCKFAQADSLINPITIISVGGTGEGEVHATEAHLEAYRQIFEEAQWDKDFKIITHAAMKVERVGASGQIVDTQNDFNFIREQLYAGLMVPKAVMDTEGSAYASATIGLEVLRTRYITFRNMLEKWLEKKIFAPISQIQGFFEYKNGEKVLIVPEVDWNHINLYDMNDYIQALGGYVEKKQISVHTLYRSLGLNWEEEQRLIREENVRAAIMGKEAAELAKMSLIELRALDPDEQIVESAVDETVPGQSAPGTMPEAGADGAPPDAAAMPDMTGGAAMPDMGSPPTEMPGAPAEGSGEAAPATAPSAGSEPPKE